MTSDEAPAATAAAAAAPRMLRIAAAVLVVQVTAGIVVVLTGDLYGPGGRVLTAGWIALGYVFARSAVHLRAAGAFGVLILELTALLVALGATGWPSAARAVLFASALAVIGLLFASLHAFPSPSVPVR